MKVSTTIPFLIFGYGSLIDRRSLIATVPDAANIRPAYIKGFYRDFCLWDPEGWTETELDVAGVPFCAVDIRKTDKSSSLNGIVFEMSSVHFETLKRREQQYELLQTSVYNFVDDSILGDCFVFCANKQTGQYVFDEPAQERYLKLMLNGAKEYGESFYHELLATTYLNGKSLREMPVLVESLNSRPAH